MGKAFSRAIKKLFDKKVNSRMLMLGLDAAGKTTVLYQLKLGEVVTTIPTIGFNVEELEYKNLRMTVWDIGGQERIRPLWRHYYENSNGLIWVIDSNDTDRIDDENRDEPDSAKHELWRLLQDDSLRGVPLLVLANKQDLPYAISPQKIYQRLGLDKVKDRPVHVQGCVAKTCDGLYEGLDWLNTTISNKKKKSKK